MSDLAQYKSSASKSLFLGSLESVSAHQVQLNFPRVVLQDAEASMPSARRVWVGGIKWKVLHAKVESVVPSVSFAQIEALANFFYNGGQDSVAQLWGRLQEDQVPSGVLTTIINTVHSITSEQSAIQEATPAPESFLRRAHRLEHSGQLNAALDIIYDNVDAHLRSNQFDALDAMLRGLHVQEYSTDLLLGLLTATLPARSKLRGRESFFAKVEAAVNERKEHEAGLLEGLQ